jgi:nucleotide-binding universal stress UspA family protein
VKIVVGYLMSPAGEAALDAAVDEARFRGASLLVMQSSKGGPHESLEVAEAIREAGERIEQRLTQEGLPFELRYYVRGNDPAEDILQVAEDEGAGLIVIGLRQRSRTGKMLLGSNAHDILMHAPCPVLSVRAPGDI